MQDLLTRFPKIDAVFGQDDPMALGALEAIKAQGREKEIKVFGVNGNKEACQAIKAGDMYGTALQLSYLVGVAVRANPVGLKCPADCEREDMFPAGCPPFQAEDADHGFDADLLGNGISSGTKCPLKRFRIGKECPCLTFSAISFSRRCKSPSRAREARSPGLGVSASPVLFEPSG